MSGSIALSRSEFSVLETDGAVSIAFVRTGDLTKPVTVQYGITVGATDFDNASADDVGLGTFTVTIPAGAERVVVEIPVFDDALAEGTESFSVSLISVNSGTLLFPRTARVDILDDEQPEGPGTEPPLTSAYDVTETAVFTGLVQPIAFEFAPHDPSLMYVAEKGGTVTLFDTATGAKVGAVLDISAQVNNTNDRGLMDIALHPDFANNPYLYVFYVVDPADTEGKTGNAGPDGQGNRFSYVERYTLDASTGYSSIVEGSNVVLLGGGADSLLDISGGGAINSTSPTNVNVPDSEINVATGAYKQDYLKVDSLSHAGGSLAFGPDGALYVSTGDGTSYNIADPRSVSVQDIDSLAGKILRIDPLTGQGLADNPFVDEAGGDLDANAAKVYQLGLRNPYSMGFDADGQLFITNTGWTNYESIFTGPAGANFGWPFFEGGDSGQLLRAPGGYSSLPEAQAFYDAVAAGDIEITAPYRSFSHRATDPGYQVSAITGADTILLSDKLPKALQGHYIFTDVVQGEVYSVSTDDRRDVQFLYKTDSPYAPVHFKQGPDGNLYYADLVFGTIGRVTITDPNEPETEVVTFGGKTYEVLADGISRADAIAAAEAMGGTLLRIDSQAELAFIMESFWKGRAIYVDASDAVTEGVWLNSDGQPVSYFNWMPGEPNSDSQDFAVIANDQGQWDDQRMNQADILAGNAWITTSAMAIVERPTDPGAGPDPEPEPGGFDVAHYRVLEDGLTRDEALAAAEAAGGTLLRIDSQAELDFIMETFWQDRGIYLDVSDAAEEGVWRNSDGELVTFFNWRVGEPNNWRDQDYAVIADRSGKWDDQDRDQADIHNGQRWTTAQAMTIIELPRGDSSGPEPDPDTFGGKRYVRLDDGLSRAEAQAQAAEMGGRLLTVDSKLEQDFVMNRFWDGKAIYIDLSDAAEEGVWRGIDGAESDYFNWLPNEPNNANSGLQDFAVIAHASGRWDDQRVDQASVLRDDGRWYATEAVSIVEIVIGDDDLSI